MNKKTQLGAVVAQVQGYRIRHAVKTKTITGGFSVYAGKRLLTNFYISNKTRAIVEAEKLCK